MALVDRSRPRLALTRRSLPALTAGLLALSAAWPGSTGTAPASRGAVSAVSATGTSPAGRPSTATTNQLSPQRSRPRSRSQPRSSRSAAESWARVVGAAAGPAGGYWAALADGTVVSAGTAPPLEASAPATDQAAAGQAPSNQAPCGQTPSNPTTAIAADPAAEGYWLLCSDGQVEAFGAARSFGSRSLHAAVAIASAPGGHGYWVVTALGHVFAFGEARWAGSAADRTLASPVVGITPTPDGRGYRLVTRRGQVLAYGNATAARQALGTGSGATGSGATGPAASAGSRVIGMAPAPGGHGYWLATSDGQVLALDGAAWHGNGSGELAGASVVSFAAGGEGYWMLTSTGRVLCFDAPRLPPVSLPTVPTTPLPVGSDPARSISPPAAFSVSCFAPGSVTACNRAALTAIDTARATEGYGPLLLPADFSGLAPGAQLVAVANAERTSRGLPALPQSAPLDALALQGARAGRDPLGPPLHSWASNISWGYRTALAADFAWMYDDGPGGPNVDCPRAGAPGCWGHRRNILAPWSGASGAAAVSTSQGWVLTELFVAGAR